MKITWVASLLRGDEVFKALHLKLLPSWYYALDGDLLLVEKTPPIIVAHLEFKVMDEPITFAQAIAFNQMVNAPLPWRIPVFIIRSEHRILETQMHKDDLVANPGVLQRVLSTHRFSIYEYAGADWRPQPPRTQEILVAHSIGWSEFQQWEAELRSRRRLEVSKAPTSSFRQV